MVIDRDVFTFEGLSPDFNGFRVEGDATHIAILKQVKLGRTDLFIATTHEYSVNLMVAQVARNSEVRSMAVLIPLTTGDVFLFTRSALYP